MSCAQYLTIIRQDCSKILQNVLLGLAAELYWSPSRGGCARITKRHATPEGSRCCLIPVLSGLQEYNYVTLQYKQVMTRAQPPLESIFRDYLLPSNGGQGISSCDATDFYTLVFTNIEWFTKCA